TRILSTYKKDPTYELSFLCKIRTFTLFLSLTLASAFIALGSIDRYFCSCRSVSMRSLSNLRNARRLSLLTTVIGILLYVEIFYCHEANLSTAPVPCYSKNLPCRLYNDLGFLIFYIFIPLSVMTIFGCLTIGNIKRFRQITPLQISKTATTSLPLTGIKRRNDRQLIKMLFAEVLLLLFIDTPVGLQRFYTTIEMSVIKTPLRVAIDDFVLQLFSSCQYAGNAIPFFLYLFTGSIFRAIIKKLFVS
ncbi:unnamed protein product, partial [Didymodactylos carnosus]